MFDNIVRQKLLTKNMFSFYYSKLPKDSSAIVLGKPARELYKGELTFIDVSREFYWELQMRDIKVRRRRLPCSSAASSARSQVVCVRR